MALNTPANSVHFGPGVASCTSIRIEWPAFMPANRMRGLKFLSKAVRGLNFTGMEDVTRLRKNPRSPDRGGMRGSSKALAKEDWSFGGLRRTIGSTGSWRWGSTGL